MEKLKETIKNIAKQYDSWFNEGKFKGQNCQMTLSCTTYDDTDGIHTTATHTVQITKFCYDCMYIPMITLIDKYPCTHYNFLFVAFKNDEDGYPTDDVSYQDDKVLGENGVDILPF